jgi:hypothetical protein
MVLADALRGKCGLYLRAASYLQMPKPALTDSPTVGATRAWLPLAPRTLLRPEAAAAADHAAPTGSVLG